MKDQILTDPECIVHLEKMAVLGSLAAGVAHEINTPLSALKSNSDLFSRYCESLKSIIFNASMPDEVKENDEIKSIFENIDELNDINKTATTRIVDIVNSLRKFVRMDAKEKEYADLNSGLDSTLTLVQHMLKNRIVIKKDYGELPPVKCYPNHMNQVFLNILTNASQAIEDKGEITIKTYFEDNTVYIIISDTGVGIPEENLDKIFEAGFTTKKSETGTGIGLSIVKQILQKHNAKIYVESEIDKGATFTIELPAIL